MLKRELNGKRPHQLTRRLQRLRNRHPAAWDSSRMVTLGRLRRAQDAAQFKKRLREAVAKIKAVVSRRDQALAAIQPAPWPDDPEPEDDITRALRHQGLVAEAGTYHLPDDNSDAELKEIEEDLTKLASIRPDTGVDPTAGRWGEWLDPNVFAAMYTSGPTLLILWAWIGPHEVKDVGRSRKDLKKLRAAQQEAYLIYVAPDGTFEAEAEDPTSPLDQAALPSDASDDDSPQRGANGDRISFVRAGRRSTCSPANVVIKLQETTPGAWRAVGRTTPSLRFGTPPALSMRRRLVDGGLQGGHAGKPDAC
ncbi:hypothetical protein CYMTET_5370 [Cymbomonas tetramitiformis]|uniref:Uncharacterized protein n=1 Tax=Cymbomonas tetramitiformis TaxID=36881 RepID=A0AAE0LJ50_9CHLO|nr:hypothetical protein CYMTET_5370 [Cymbomonas tetramitiformis]